MIRSLFLVVALGFFAGCASAPAPMPSSEVAELRLAAADPASEGATAARYARLRAAFVAEMEGEKARYQAASSSVAGTVKNSVAGAGVLVGLGGTVASFVVENEDTKASVSQIGGLVASVSGILGLLPIGLVPQGTNAIVTYLEMELPLFESRWPASWEGDLSAEEWNGFASHAVQIRDVVERLGE